MTGIHRRHVVLASGLAALTAGLVTGLYARFVGPRRYQSTTASMALERWPKELDGVIVAVVADIHLGCRYGRAWTTPALDAAVNAVGLARPDILIVCGDFVFRDWNPAEAAASAARFEAPLRIAILGNHDYGHGKCGADALADALQDRGFDVLRNETRDYEVRGHPIWVAGLDDWLRGPFDVDATLAGMPADAAPAILLAHEPDAVLSVPWGRFDLAISGHTHGGQIAIPLLNRWLVRAWAKTRFDRGLYHLDGLALYVTKGLGMVGFHARLRSRPEVVFLRLHAVSDQAGP